MCNGERKTMLHSRLVCFYQTDNYYLFDKSKPNVNVSSVLFRDICLVMFDIKQKLKLGISLNKSCDPQ